jgi:hypothetical protein
VTQVARNRGDITPPPAVSDVTVAAAGSHGATVSWTNQGGGATEIAVIRGTAGGPCPQKPADGNRIGGTAVRSSQADPDATAGSAYCYAVFALDRVGNRSAATTQTFTVPTPPKPADQAAQPESGGSSLSTVVGLVGGGAIVLTGLAYATLRLVRREWEWHARTGYGIRDLMSVDVHGYDRTALLIPAVIGVCIAGAVVVLLMSL